MFDRREALRYVLGLAALAPVAMLSFPQHVYGNSQDATRDALTGKARNKSYRIDKTIILQSGMVFESCRFVSNPGNSYAMKYPGNGKVIISNCVFTKAGIENA